MAQLKKGRKQHKTRNLIERRIAVYHSYCKNRNNCISELCVKKYICEKMYCVL
ncbi:MAG: hypothetical protein JWN76_2167 [Chitinophagaceae bacterium]|nr:hypothetical protein [Chitinophagaceae bacterium]